jgi:hypothetical protein
MRRRFAASLLFLGLIVSGIGFARAADPDRLADDEQTVRAAGAGTDGPALLDFLRKNTLTDADRRRIVLLVRQLGDDDFDVREKASADLVGFGARAVAFLRPATEDRDPEVARRAANCLLHLERGGMSTPAPGRALAAAVRLVAARKPAGAAEVLLDYLPQSDEETLFEELQTALVALAVREGKAEPALAAALTAEASLRRGAAGAALARAGVADHRDAVRKLLKDPEPAVRLRVGLALAAAREKHAVPVLIDLLGRLPPEQVWPVVDLLERMAGEKAPAVSLGTDAEGRGKCRDAWAAWWRDHGAGVEMPAAEALRTFRGHRLIVICDYGTVSELDRDGKLCWQVGGLQSAMDAQVLPGNRILAAEYSGRVSERTLKGEIVWVKDVPSAMQCQRLANGSTFVVSPYRLLEFDPAGKEKLLYSHNRGGTALVAARKQRNGNIITVDSDGLCRTLDAGGKELSSFPTGKVSNSCLDVLPNGHILITRFFDGKVTEHDARGTVVWQIDFPSPFSAQRLPNGNTLVACHEPARVVELDRAGKIVWEHRTESPNHRPWFASGR